MIDNRDQAKDLAQVYKDCVRDTMVINGQNFVCADGDVIIEALFNRIHTLYRQYHRLDDIGGVGIADTVLRDHYITKNTLAYTRAVLLASCRTVSGGDTYDAVDFMLRNEEVSVICPDSEYVAPVRITVFYADEDGSAGAPFSTRNVAEERRVYKKSMTVPPVSSPDKHRRVQSAVATKSQSLELGKFARRAESVSAQTDTHNGRERANTASKLQPEDGSGPRGQSKIHALHARFASNRSIGGASASPGNIGGLLKRLGSAGKSRTSWKSKKRVSRVLSVESLPEELEVLESMAWPHVRVDVESRYRVMDADPTGDGDPMMAKLQTNFSRSFSWGRHTYSKPGTVAVQVLDKFDEFDEDELPTRGRHDSTGSQRHMVRASSLVEL